MHDARGHDGADGDGADDAAQQRLGLRLRAIRSQQDLTLQQVEERSGGKWKAVVVGSYERGDRSISLIKLVELAQFYGVPVSEFLPAPVGDVDLTEQAGDGRVVIDLTQLIGEGDPQLRTVARYAQHIQARRGDYNGRVLTLRGADVQAMAAACGIDEHELLDTLEQHQVLRTASR